jgi:predicted metal-binding protein
MSEREEKSGARCVAVVQCAVAQERCAGVHCALAFHRREHHFAGYGPDTIYMSMSCGGCPGRRVSRLAANLKNMMRKEAGLEPSEIVVHLAACVVTDNGHYPPCPHLDYIKTILARKGLRVVEGTYVSATAAQRRKTGSYQR